MLARPIAVPARAPSSVPVPCVMYLGLRTNWDLVEGLKAVKNGGGIGDAVR